MKEKSLLALAKDFKKNNDHESFLKILHFCFDEMKEAHKCNSFETFDEKYFNLVFDIIEKLTFNNEIEAFESVFKEIDTNRKSETTNMSFCEDYMHPFFDSYNLTPLELEKFSKIIDLTKKEKELFISYIDYKNKQRTISEIAKSNKLTYYSVQSSFEEIRCKIKKNLKILKQKGYVVDNNLIRKK